MAWVPEIPEEQASPELRRLYEMIRPDFGFVPSFFGAQGLQPQAIAAELSLFPAIMQDGALPRKIKEQIAVVVSGLNTSSYCVALHIDLLKKLGIDKPIGRKLAVDYPNAPVGPDVLALFHFADRLTKAPADIVQSDVDALRAAGWNDQQILETVLTAALFNFANRVSIGLGLMADF